MNEKTLQFKNFLRGVEKGSHKQNTTANGIVTIQQTERNKLRKEGVEAFKADLEMLYGDEFDIVETKQGIVIAVELADGTTFSWEVKNTIKALDYDPFMAANDYDDHLAEQEAKKEELATRKAKEEAERAAKRKAKMEEAARREEEARRLGRG